MKRSVTLVAILASLALAATSLARPSGHRPRAVTSATQPDQVIQWNQELLNLLPAGQPANIHPTRTLAIAQLAVLDAVKATEVRGSGRALTMNAAVASAGRTALEALLLPSQNAAIES